MKILSSVCIALTVSCGVALAQSIDVPPGQHAVLSAEGRGVQIYKCDTAPAGSPAWILVAPEAQLYVGGKAVGTHAAGPTWTYAGGTVHGKMLATQPSPDGASIPWLLVKGVSYDGTGLMATVTYVQRTDTKGGKASIGCDTEHQGSTSRVPYSATYTFYAAIN